jgi:hypothetical protein
MGTKYADLFAALAATFEPSEVKVRSQANRQLHYITARTAMNRLDNVLGPENWWDDYVPGESSVLCRLTIRLPDGQELTKCDAGGYAGMSDQGDDDKSGYSDAFKRAAVKFGVGRYLYRDGVPEFVREKAGPVELPSHARDSQPEPARDGRREVNEQFKPQPQSQPRGDRPAQPQANGNGHADGHDDRPRSGKALFAWTKKQEERHEVGLLKYLNNWAKLQEFPGRMVDWDAEQVSLAYREAVRKLQSVASAQSEGYEEAIEN